MLRRAGRRLRRRREPDPLGTGLWRRVNDDCATAGRHVRELHDLLPDLRALAEAGQARWPSDTLDVPADPAGRAHYQHLRDAARAFREVAYRRRLADVDREPRHEALAARALVQATESLTAARRELD